MRTRNLFGLLLSLAVLIMTGCGGGGGGGSVNNGTTVSGVASKGPIKNGHFQAFQIFSSHNSAKSRPSATPFFSGITDDKGNYSVAVPAAIKKDGIYIKIVDGTYLDEATQSEKHVETEYPNGMRAAFGNISGAVKRGENVRVHVTPYTEMAFRSASASLDDNSVNLGQHEIEHAFGLDNKGVDIIHTEPLDPSVAPPAGAGAAQKAYTNSLGIISQYEKDNAAVHTRLDDFGTDLIAEIHNNNGQLAVGTVSSLQSSELAFDNSGNDHSGVTPAGVTVTVTASKASASVSNDPVTITATVLASGVAVSGTEVKFAIKSGAGILAEKSVLTNASGVASTTLSSTVDGDVDVVTATAGGIPSDSPSVSFTNPNKPLSVALAANPGSGTTVSNGGVTLSATVTPAGAGGVIPNGTVVTFTITSGSGTLSAVTTTSGGVATATLSSGTANTVSVTATAGAATSPVLNVNFIAQPTLALVRVATSGTLPAGSTIGGIQATITYAPTGSYTIGNADVSTSGASLTAPSAPLLQPNVTTGSIILGLLDVNGAGIGLQAGEFATLRFHVAAGTFVAPTLTVAAGAQVFDTNNQLIPGMTVTVLPAILQ